MNLHPPPQHILIVRPSALGDVCRTVPVLASLRKAYPTAKIDWLVQDDFAPAIAAHPALNEVMAFPRSQLAQWWKGPRRVVDLLRWFGRLRQCRYDMVLDCQGLGRSGLMTWVSGAPARVGLRSARELAWLGYNVRVDDPSDATKPIHTVDQMLSLLHRINVPVVRDMQLYVHQEHQRWWREQIRTMLGDHGEMKKYAVLAPTARWESKRWPIERFAQLLEPLVMRGFEKVIVIGSPSEIDQIQPLRQKADRLGASTCVVDLVGKTNIGQTMAVIAGAGLVVANDSAPLHMAVGFHRPCVALFGPTDPDVVGPYQCESSVIRGYQPVSGEGINFKDSKLGDRLMRYISTTSVIQRIDSVLDTFNSELGCIPKVVPIETHACMEGTRL